MKKISSLFLVIAMLLTIVPFAAFAEEAAPTMDEALNVKDGTLSFTAKDWEVVAEDSAEGRVYAVSTNHASESTSTIKLVAEVKAGDILTFEAAASSEENFDGIAFAVDGEDQMMISGEQDWDTYYYVFEEEGTYVLTWKYIKDSSGDEGDDIGCLDNIYLGENTFELEDFAVTESLTMIVDMEKAIDVVAIPAFAPLGTVTYESNDTSIATVSEDGIVTAVALGETTVTVKTDALEEAAKEVKIAVVEPKLADAFLIYDDSEENELGLYEVELITNSLKQKIAFSDFLGTYITEGFFGPMEVQETIYSAEYIDGRIYMLTDAGRFVVLNAETLKVETEVGNLETGEDLITDWVVVDLAYDYTSCTLFGIGYNANDDGLYIVAVDTETGDIDEVAAMPFIANVFATDDGTFYSIDSNTGKLYSITIEDGEAKATEVASLGYATAYLQSMAFDHATGELYWLGVGGDAEVSEDEREMMAFSAKINLEEGKFDLFTVTDPMMEFAGLYFEYTDDTEKVAATGVTLDQTEVSVKWHEQVKLTATVTPENATNKNVRWTSSDETIAIVKGGVVTGLAEGEATITVTTRDGGFTAECKVTVTDTPTFLFEESFEPAEDGSFPFEQTWKIIDADKDGNDWDAYADPQLAAYDGIGVVTSASFINDVGAVTPDNWLISPSFKVYEETTASWYVAAQDAAYSDENYAVYVVPAEYAEEDLAKLTPVYDGTATGAWTNITVDISEYAGQEVRLAFRHYNTTDMYWIKLDLVQVYTFAELEPDVLIGDANGDGEINTADATVILKSAADMIELSDEQKVAADVDYSGKVDTYDAVLILKYAADMIPGFDKPVEE